MFDVERTFIEKMLNGEVLSEEIDDFIGRWHDGVGDTPLHIFLGMSEDEYSLWLADPAYLSLIVAARHNELPITDAVNDNFVEVRLAAQSGPQGKLAQLQKWVEAHR